MRMILTAAAAALSLAGPAAPQLTFTEVAVERGVEVPTYGRGAAMVDLDQDGRLDLALANSGQGVIMFRQLPDGTFEDVTTAWGIDTVGDQSWGMVVADMDNDGDPDAFVMSGGMVGAGQNRLLRNDLSTSGVFTDVSSQTGDLDFVSRTTGSTALDYDLDGDLDLYVCETKSGGMPGSSYLFRNDGGLVFTDVSAAAGVDVTGDFKHCGAGDINNDGWPDIGVGDLATPNRLFRNNGDGTFTDIAASAGVDTVVKAFGMVFEDYDNDGWMDIYVPRYQSPILGPSGLFLNNGDETFTDVSVSSGMTGQQDMGHHSGDLDADGHPDIFSGTGSPGVMSLDVVTRITPDGIGGILATDVSVSSGVAGGGVTRSHGSPFGDVDGDGDIDVYVNAGGPSTITNTIQRNFLWLNDGNANAWVAVDLQGVISNRSAVGARSVAVTGTGREIHRHLTAGKGFANTDSPTQHFGLGGETDVDHIQVTWPSGIEQILLDPDPFERHAMIETGLRFHGPAVIGTVVTIEMVGPPDAVAELIVSGFTQYVPLKKFGGILQVAEPWIGPIPWSLGPDGHFELLSPIPNDPLLIGATAYVQAWTHVPGTKENQALTNLLTITIE